MTTPVVALEDRVYRKYTPADVDRGLLELAHVGNAAQASRNLQEQGLDIPGDTLRSWTRSHAERYSVIRTEVKEKAEEGLIHDFREIAQLAVQAERLALEKTIEQLEGDNAKDPSSAARNAATVKGITVANMLTLDGRPSVITQTRQASDIIAELVKIAPNVFRVDSTVTDVISPAPLEDTT